LAKIPLAVKDAEIESARARRVGQMLEFTVITQWFVAELANVVDMTLQQRMRIAIAYLKSRVVINISKPVGKKIITTLSGTTRSRFNKNWQKFTPGRKKWKEKRIVFERSKEGEFPRADTTQLMKTINTEVINRGKGVIDGYVGTPLDYGVKLEHKMNRSFLRRTLREERHFIEKIFLAVIPVQNLQFRDSHGKGNRGASK
jgi:hypothetical protein